MIAFEGESPQGASQETSKRPFNVETPNGLHFLTGMLDHISESIKEAAIGEEAFTVGRLGLITMAFPEQLMIYIEQTADESARNMVHDWQNLVKELQQHALTATDGNKFLHQEPNRELVQRINDLVKRTEDVLLHRKKKLRDRIPGLMALTRLMDEMSEKKAA